MRLLWTVLAAGALAGCGPSELEKAAAAHQAHIAELRKPILEQLKDPYTAQFENEIVADDGELCGTVNSKNEFGAYVGARKFLVVPGEYARLRGLPMIVLQESRQLSADLEGIGARLSEYNARKRRELALTSGGAITTGPTTIEEAFAENFDKDWSNRCAEGA